MLSQALAGVEVGVDNCYNDESCCEELARRAAACLAAIEGVSDDKSAQDHMLHRSALCTIYMHSHSRILTTLP
jgi:hypothetical protein